MPPNTGTVLSGGISRLTGRVLLRFGGGLPPIPFLLGFLPIRYGHVGQLSSGHSRIAFRDPPMHSRQCLLISFTLGLPFPMR